MTQPANSAFTAIQIARAAGMTRQAVHAALQRTESAGVVSAGGKDVAAWRFDDLPLDWKLEIARRGVKRGFENGEAFLASLPLTPWASPLPWDRIPKHEQDKAVRLQKAMLRALGLRGDPAAAAGQVERAGLEDYRTEFKYSISARHWRRLLARTTERDGGEENWQRLDLYLDDRAFAVKPTCALLRHKPDHEPLAVFLSTLKNRLKPTMEEREFLWKKAFEHFEEMTKSIANSPAGNRERRVIKASLVFYLSNAFPAGTLCATEASLRRRFDEKLAQWRNHGAPALIDHRCNSGPAKKILCPACRPLMIGATVDLDGNYRHAWRRMHLEGKLCEGCRSAWKYDVRVAKSYCPKNVIPDIRPDVELALPWRKGPKHVRLISPSVKRDWSDTAPGDYSVMDDTTPDHVTFGSVQLPLAYGEDLTGKPFVGRLEVLVSADERTDYPLAFVAILGDPETFAAPQVKASYNQVHQRMLLLRQHDTIGLPHIGLKLENGPWRNYLMDGENVEHWRTLGVPVFENGLTEMGLRIRRAIPGNPRSKIIERVFHSVQSRMRCHPGFVGNNERLEKREAVQDFIARVKRGKEDPANELMHVSQFIKLLSDEFLAFAEEAQNGERLPRVSPREAFYNGIDGHPGYSSKPLRQFAANARFLLASHERELYVGPNGVTLKLAGQRFPFWGNELKPYCHTRILARFNIEEPELLSCRAADGQTFTLKARIQMANTESQEQLAQTAKDRASWVRRGKVLFDSLPHPFRSTIARDSAHSEEVRRFGDAYTAELETFKVNESAEKSKRQNAHKRARALGVPQMTANRYPDRVLQADNMRRKAEQLEEKGVV